MLSKKGALVVAFSLLAGLQFSKIYVPEGFERPIFFKMKYVGMEFLGYLAKFAESSNFGIEPANFRYLIQGLIALNKKTDSQIKVSDQKINGVNARVYSLNEKPSAKPSPIMIFFHGGGFFMSDTTTYDLYFFELIKRKNLIVISVDYRMSPEYAFPIPTSDSYAVTSYVFKNAHSFNGDPDKIILAGDSAGGNIAAVLTQKLVKEKKKLPKLLILIYPWTQMMNLKLPSSLKYSHTGLMSKYTIGKCIAWYLGHRKVSRELEELFTSNNHTVLLNTDFGLKNKLISYLSVDLIPEEYKKTYNYYQNYNPLIYYPNFKKSDIDLIKKDKNLEDLVIKLFSDECSPGLADDSILKGFPKTHFIIAEWCTFKDESLIYSERLRRAGVDVDIAFYDQGFHGVLTFIDPNFSYSIAHKMFDDLVVYLEKNI